MLGCDRDSDTGRIKFEQRICNSTTDIHFTPFRYSSIKLNANSGNTVCLIFFYGQRNIK
jgi:hypothetical protein